jgi:membrane protease YdiL (CAAX protease family)
MAFAVRSKRERDLVPVDVDDEEFVAWFREATRGTPGEASATENLPPVSPTGSALRPAAAVLAQPVPVAGRKATRTVIGFIVANVALQGVMYLVGNANHWGIGTSLRASLLSGAFFYGVAACVIGMRADDLHIHPVWLRGPAKEAIALGAAVGGAVAVVLSAVMFLGAGHAVVDPFAGLLAGSSNPMLLIGGGLLIAAVAPLVEELVFRGFLAEGLRHRGRWSAIVLSGVAFSIAHLRFAQFKYYLLMGIGFGALYWARGLAASIAAHAAFNGMLVVFAVASMHGPAQILHAANIDLSLPATWHEVNVKQAVDIAIVGPGGAQLSVSHVDIPAGGAINADRLATVLRSGQLPMDTGTRLDPSSVKISTLPFGRVVEATAMVHGHADRTVFALTGSRMVVFEVVAEGSDAANRDFDAMLQKVTLPA